MKDEEIQSLTKKLEDLEQINQVWNLVHFHQDESLYVGAIIFSNPISLGGVCCSLQLYWEFVLFESKLQVIAMQ